MHRLKKSTEPLGEIGNRDPISGAKQNHHRLANHPAEPKQDCRNNSRERCRHQHARDCLQPIRAQRVGSFFESARNVAERVFCQSKNRRHGHEREQSTGGKYIETLANRKKRDPFHERHLRQSAHGLTDNRNPKKTEND